MGRGKSNFTMKKNEQHYFTQETKLNVIRTSQANRCEEMAFDLSCFLPFEKSPHLSNKETLGDPKFRSILQSTPPVVNIIRNKESLRHCHSLEKSAESQQPGWDSETEKEY